MYAEVNAIMLEWCSIPPLHINARPKKLLEVFRNFFVLHAGGPLAWYHPGLLPVRIEKS